jgi:hypothetical protein
MLYDDKPELLKEDVQLARDFHIKLAEPELKKFLTQLWQQRYQDLHRWHERQIALDTFD